MKIPSPFPELSKKASLSIIFLSICLWLVFTDLKSKTGGVIIAGLFSLLELCWIGMTVEDSQGGITFRPFDKNCRKPKTVNKEF